MENAMESKTSPEMAAYYGLPLFVDFTKASKVWIAARDIYNSSKFTNKDLARNALIAAEELQFDYLIKLRDTPEHLAAFGW